MQYSKLSLLFNENIPLHVFLNIWVLVSTACLHARWDCGKDSKKIANEKTIDTSIKPLLLWRNLCRNGWIGAWEKQEFRE